jgi:hypothetical protein
MKEIPLLFSTPMVQAILQGRKTMTRRIADVPVGDHNGIDIMDWGLSKYPYQEDGTWKYRVQTKVDESEGYILKSKYGQPGDLLWVRETWGVGSRPDPIVGSVDGFEFKADQAMIDEIESLPIYPCDDFDFGNYDKKGWRPSIHMPKEAARIWLQVRSIRVERLQDISEEDAIAEGVEKINNGPFPYKHYGSDTTSCAYAKTSFQSLWQSINGDESWEANPFIWVISFNVLSTTGKPSSITEKINA